jgi:hypothetical protein
VLVLTYDLVDGRLEYSPCVLGLEVAAGVLAWRIIRTCGHCVGCVCGRSADSAIVTVGITRATRFYA